MKLGELKIKEGLMIYFIGFIIYLSFSSTMFQITSMNFLSLLGNWTAFCMVFSFGLWITEIILDFISDKKKKELKP